MSGLLIISLIIGCATQANAQFSWGTRTGLQVSTLHFNKNDDFVNRKSSYLIPGFYFEQVVGKQTKLSLDLQFSNKGYTSVASTEGRYNLQYFSFPLLVSYKLNDVISIYAGPDISLQVGSHSIVNHEIIPNDLFKQPLDFGIRGGLAFQISSNYSLMLTYIHGLSNTINPDLLTGRRPVFASDDKITNRSLQVSLSTAFSIPKNQKNSSVSFSLRQGVLNSSIYVLGDNGLTNETESGKIIGYEAGLEAKIGIQKYFFINTGLIYNQKGGKFIDDKAVRINYLSVPILFGISPILEKEITFSVEGGLSLNKQINSDNPYEAITPNITSYTNTASFLYGFELEAPIKNRTSLFLSYRNIVDQSRFLAGEDNNGNQYYDFNFKSESFSIGLRLKAGNRKIMDRETPFENHSSIGLKGGISVNTLQYKNQPASYNSRSSAAFGWLAGMYFKIRLGQRFAFIPEIQYTTTQFFNSFDNPLMLSYALNKKYEVETGLKWSINQSKNIDEFDGYVVYTSKPVDLGLNFGIKHKINRKISVGVRYHHGLVDMISWYDSQGYRLSTSGYNRNLQLAAYYSF